MQTTADISCQEGAVVGKIEGSRGRWFAHYKKLQECEMHIMIKLKKNNQLIVEGASFVEFKEALLEASENKIEDILTFNPILRHILPYLTKKDIDALRLTSKPIYSAITSVLFSSHALLSKSPALCLSRNNALHFLSTTHLPLPKNVLPSALIGHLNARDDIHIHVALLRLLLKQYQLNSEITINLMVALMSGDAIYLDTFKTLTGYPPEHTKIEVSNVCSYQDIIRILDSLQPNKVTLFDKVKKRLLTKYRLAL